jgi:hypothetical protein
VLRWSDDQVLPPDTPPSPTLGVEVPGVPWDNPEPSLELHACSTLSAVDLSTDPLVQFDCERCGRPYGLYNVHESPGALILLEPDESFRLGRRAPPTGRHRARQIFDARVGSKGNAYAFECGCAHKRTIGLGALRRKLERATELRIWL